MANISMNENVTSHQKIFYSTSKYILLKNFFFVISGVLSIFIVRFLGPQEYGKWTLVYQLVATIGPVVSLGFLSTLAKFIPECKSNDDKNILFSQSFIVIICSSAIFLVCFYSVTNIFPGILPGEIKNVRYAFGVFVCMLALLNLMEGFFRGLGRFNIWTVIDGSRSALSAGIATILFIIFTSRYETIFYTYLYVIMTFVLIVFILQKNRFNLSANIGIPSEVARFTATMVTGQILFLIMITIDSVLLRAILKDPSQVGYYNAGINIPRLLETMLISPLSTPFLYFFTHKETSMTKERMLEFGSRVLGIGCGLVALVLFSFADKIILILLGLAYVESIPVLRIFALVLFNVGFTALFNPYFLSINRPIYQIFLSVMNIILYVIFYILLIPRYKAVGPAIGIFVVTTMQIFVIFCLIRNQNINILKYLKNYLLMLGCMVVAVLSGYLLHFYVSLVVFVAAILLTRLITLDDIRILRKITVFRSI